MDARPFLGDLLAFAHETATDVRTMGDYAKAQQIVALQAEIATQPFCHDLVARRLADHFRAEVWRLAKH